MQLERTTVSYVVITVISYSLEGKFWRRHYEFTRITGVDV